MINGKREVLFAVVGLPLLLFGFTYGIIGFYYETNDDQIITLLLRGLTIRPALQDLSIYFFGFSQAMAWLYSILPAVPWYGIILYCWLLVATGLACWLVLQAFPQVKPWQRWGLVTGFYIFCWLEHVMWFNYLRVPLLLAGTSFLFLLRSQAKGGAFRGWPWLLSGLLFVTALCIRPSAALLGLLVVGPAAIFLDGAAARRGRSWAPVAFFLASVLAFSLWRHLHQTPAARQYQKLDLWKSAVLDYGIYQPRLNSPADSLAYAGIGHWFLADQQVLNEDFYRQKGSINPAYMVHQVAPQKAAALLEGLARDQFFVLWVNAFLIAWICAARRALRLRLIGYEVYFWLLLLAIGIVLKLPPRVLTPSLSLYTLVHLFILSGARIPASNSRYRLAWVVTGVAALGYLLKVGHRANLQQQRQQAHEQFIGEVARASRGQVLVYSVLPDYFRSLSPLQNYDFGAAVLFPITGWSTLDPGYPGFYRSQTGKASFVAALLALNRQGTTVWLLEPGFDLFLNKYLQAWHGTPLHLVRQPSPLERYGVEVFSPGAK